MIDLNDGTPTSAVSQRTLALSFMIHHSQARHPSFPHHHYWQTILLLLFKPFYRQASSICYFFYLEICHCKSTPQAEGIINSPLTTQVLAVSFQSLHNASVRFQAAFPQFIQVVNHIIVSLHTHTPPQVFSHAPHRQRGWNTKQRVKLAPDVHFPSLLTLWNKFIYFTDSPLSLAKKKIHVKFSDNSLSKTNQMHTVCSLKEQFVITGHWDCVIVMCIANLCSAQIQTSSKMEQTDTLRMKSLWVKLRQKLHEQLTGEIQEELWNLPCPPELVMPAAELWALLLSMAWSWGR